MEPAHQSAYLRTGRDVPGTPSDAASRCIRDLAADLERQGGLAPDDVYRLVAAHRLSPDDAAAVFKALVDRGVELDEAPQEVERLDAESERAGRDWTNRIGSHRILTAAEEVGLGRRIHLGQDTVVATAGREPTAAETELIRDGREAHQSLVRSNVRLAISIARRYIGQGVELDDLIQEGVLGLMRAADKFDHTLGFKFSTYATWWIRQSIDRAIANSARVIRLPVHVVEDIHRVVRTQRRMETAYGRPASLAELSFELDMKVEKISALLDYSRGVVSLDQLVGDDITLGELRLDTKAAPDFAVERAILRRDVDARLQAVGHALGYRSEDVLRRRFGFSNQGEVQTLEDIGRVYGVTRERIRQIESKTLKSEYVRELFQDLNESWFLNDPE